MPINQHVPLPAKLCTQRPCVTSPPIGPQKADAKISSSLGSHEFNMTLKIEKSLRRNSFIFSPKEHAHRRHAMIPAFVRKLKTEKLCSQSGQTTPVLKGLLITQSFALLIVLAGLLTKPNG
jgi:hypothetical protein